MSWLLVGLGNPGPRYETTRHNAGFLVLDILSDEFRVEWASGTSKFQGEMGKGRILDQSCILLKPMTYMNRSGTSVAKALNYFKIELDRLVVFYDDVDVPRGKVKARIGGGTGGHKGIKSIVNCIGTEAFHRIKLGIGRPAVPEGAEEAPREVQDVSDWVLDPFSDDELKMLDETVYPEALIRLRGIFQQSVVEVDD